jgi:hypothetical protein
MVGAAALGWIRYVGIILGVGVLLFVIGVVLGMLSQRGRAPSQPSEPGRH